MTFATQRSARHALLALNIATAGCAGSAPTSGARVLDAGRRELEVGADIALVALCESPGGCNPMPLASPTVGLRAGIIDHWLELSGRVNLTFVRLEAKVELIRTNALCFSLAPSAYGFLPSDTPLPWGQVLAIGEWRATPRAALVAFGGPTMGLEEEAPTPIVGAGIDFQLTSAWRMHPWIQLNAPPSFETSAPPRPVAAGGIAFAFGFGRIASDAGFD